jgi:integrase-like protein
MPRRKRLWSHSEGEKGWTVTVYERRAGGLLYARAFNPSLRGGRGGYRRWTLGHSDQEAAKVYALEQAAKLRAGLSEIAEGKPTLARVFVAYQVHRTPRKSASEQETDPRRIELWTRVLGAQKDPNFISPAEWERFIDRRRSGEIDARGRPVAADKCRAVRDRVVEADCLWLRWVFNWAVRWRDPSGRRLLRENGTTGLEAPTELNPRRPVASDDRYEATRAVSDRVHMEIRWDGHHRVQRSYLSELLDLANGTARRITAICSLRYQDLRLEVTAATPYGAIRWPDDTDKEGREWVCPIDAKVRGALERVLRERPGIGNAFVFPSPITPEAPVPTRRATEWLLEAERLAKLPKLRGGAWHPYRRKWATARKGLPLADVAAAGGWKSKEALLRCYQQPDEATMLTVVLGAAELREKKA